MSAPAFGALRKLVRPPAGTERCEFCANDLAPQHRHVVEMANRRLLCSCRPCALLFGRPHARYHLVPEEVYALAGFQMTDVQWENLHLPIALAFFFHNSAAQRTVAIYPSPAGPTESLLPLDSWQELTDTNPVLQEMEPDVEALLVNRVNPARDYFRVGIDECYKLVGILRTNWHGLSGGSPVWDKIGAFFVDLKERSRTPSGGMSCLT